MWEYVKGSETDFEGAPSNARYAVKYNGKRGGDAGKVMFMYEYDIYKDMYPINENDSYACLVDADAWPVIAQRRKVDNLQSRVNDASLQQAFDTVQRPAHYNQSGIECIDAIAASMTPAEFQAYLKGNVQKYLWRYKHKNGVEDCRKAQWYLDRLVKELSK